MEGEDGLLDGGFTEVKIEAKKIGTVGRLRSLMCKERRKYDGSKQVCGGLRTFRSTGQFMRKVFEVFEYGHYRRNDY